MSKLRIKTKRKGNWNVEPINQAFKGAVKVGFFGSEAHPKAKLTIVELAGIHEFGTGHIPERSFLRASIVQNQAKYGKYLESKLKPLLSQQLTPTVFKQGLGLLASTDVQNYIAQGRFAPLSPETIKRKRSSRPLIDTGRLRQSVTYQVE